MSAPIALLLIRLHENKIRILPRVHRFVGSVQSVPYCARRSSCLKNIFASS